MRSTKTLRNCIWMSVLVFSMFFSIFLGIGELQGAIVDKVYHGSSQMTGGSLTVTLPNQVNLSKSFLTFSSTVDNNGPSNFLVVGYMSDNETITFERAGSSATVFIDWYVSEFISGVEVEQSTIFQGSTTNTAINPINLSSTFPIISFENNGNTFGTDDAARARITSTTNLETIVNANMANTLAYSIVDYEGANVQHNVVSLTGTSATDTITEVDLEKSFIIATSHVSGNMGADDSGVVANFSNSTQVRFERTSSTQTHSISYYVVEFTGEEEVQTGYTEFDTSTTSIDIPIQEVNLSRSIAFISFDQKGGKGTEVDDNMGTIWFTANITNKTNLKLDRAITGSDSADVQWFVVEFEGLNTPPRDPSSINLVSVDGLDLSTSDLNGSAIIEDPNGDDLNVSIQWYNNTNLVRTDHFNNSYSNGTLFSTILNSTNLSSFTNWIFSIRTFDGKNFSNWVNSSSILIKDPSAPIVNITYPLNISYNILVSELNYTLVNLSSPIDQCWYSTDGGITNISVTCGNNLTGLLSVEGSNNWAVYSNDTSGNLGFDFVSFFVDTTGPNITINAPVGQISDHTPKLNITLEEVVEVLSYSINGGPNITLCESCNGTITKFIEVEEASYTLEVYANDSLGNIGYNSTTFALDMNKNYYDSYLDNSSIRYLANVSENFGNVSFTNDALRILDVALVCATASCTDANSDVPLENHIANTMGHNVDTFADTDQTWDPTTYDVVVISESVNSGNTLWLAQEETPIVTTEGSNWDEFSLGTGGSSDSASDVDINITDNTHYITQPFSLGTLTYASTLANLGDISGFTNGVLGLGLFQSVQTLGALLVVESGDSLVNGTPAKDRRVFFASRFFGNLNSNGELLFNRSVDWAARNVNNFKMGNFSSHPINVTQNITEILNISWSEFNTDLGNNISVEISANGGLNWHNVTNGVGTSNITEGDSLIYRVIFQSNESKTISLLDMNITWSYGETLPNTTLIYPQNNSKFLRNSSINLTWYIEDGNNVSVNCDVYLNDVLVNQTTCSTGVNSTMNISLGPGDYNWSVNVSDGTNLNTSETFYFTIIDRVNVNVSKSFESVNSNLYVVRLRLQNNIDLRNNISLYDFVPQGFVNGSFNRIPNSTLVVSGGKYGGAINIWNVTLGSFESTEINYSVVGTNDYNIAENSVFGLE